MKKRKAVVSFLLALMILITTIFCVPFTASAANTAYEVTKSNGSAVRTGYYNDSKVVRTAAYGSIVWVASSTTNNKGNVWYKLTDGYWIYSGNVKKHSCSMSLVSQTNPTCTSKGSKTYRCGKCGSTSTSSLNAYGHTSNNYCTRCGRLTVKSTSSVSNVKYVVYKSGAKVHSGPYGACPTVSTPGVGTTYIITQKIVNNEGNTWYKCSAGYIYSDYIKQHSSCSWTTVSTTQSATCTSSGQVYQKCNTCNATRYASTSALGHTGSAYCSRCGIWSTSYLKSTSSVSNVKYIVSKSGAKIHNGPYGACPTISTPSVGTVLTVTQKIVNSENNTWYKCSAGYIYSDYVTKHSSCTWTTVSTTKSATCTAGGQVYQKCNACGATRYNNTNALGHTGSAYCKRCGYWSSSYLKSTSSVNSVKYIVTKDGAKVHSGPYGACLVTSNPAVGTAFVITQKVVNSEGNTWYKCSSGYIYSDYVTKHTSCTWTTVSTTKSATCTVGGQVYQKCNTCGATRYSNTNALGHTGKYYCKRCDWWTTSGFKSTSSVSNAKYIVTKDGAKLHSGPYGACKTTSTPANGTILVVTQKIVNAEGNTWYKCSSGYIYSDYVTKHSCSWTTVSTIKAATCTADGQANQKCNTCGATRNTTIKATGHTTKNYCKKCGMWNSNSLKSTSTIKNVKYVVYKSGAKVHSGPYGSCAVKSTPATGTMITVTQKVVNYEGNTWYKYSGGYIYSDYVKQHSSCTWTTVSTIKAATCTADGQENQKCTLCNAGRSVTVKKLGHTSSAYCKRCGWWTSSKLKSTSAEKSIRYNVIKEGAPIYTGPYSSCQKLGTTSKGTVVTSVQKVTNSAGNVWYKISCAGKACYIYGGNLEKHSHKNTTYNNSGVTYKVCDGCGNVNIVKSEVLPLSVVNGTVANATSSIVSTACSGNSCAPAKLNSSISASSTGANGSENALTPAKLNSSLALGSSAMSGNLPNLLFVTVGMIVLSAVLAPEAVLALAGSAILVGGVSYTVGEIVGVTLVAALAISLANDVITPMSITNSLALDIDVAEYKKEKDKSCKTSDFRKVMRIFSGLKTADNICYNMYEAYNIIRYPIPNFKGKTYDIWTYDEATVKRLCQYHAQHCIDNNTKKGYSYYDSNAERGTYKFEPAHKETFFKHAHLYVNNIKIETHVFYGMNSYGQYPLGIS